MRQLIVLLSAVAIISLCAQAEAQKSSKAKFQVVSHSSRPLEKVPGKTSASVRKGVAMSPLYDMTVKSLDNKDVKLDTYKGDVLLIVNTASKCGLTPQFAELQKLHEKYSDKGLRVLGFPCNQFANQEPGTEAEIGEFCQKNYGVTFQMFEKIDVNGGNAHPIYKLLTEETKAPIEWNFAKFLIDRNGKLVKRVPAKTSPSELAADIERLTN